MTKHEAWEKLKGNESLKRAMEVALVGGHEITVIGNPDNGKEYLEVIFEYSFSSLLLFLTPCLCGNFKDFKRECICNSEDILKVRKTQIYQVGLNNHIIVRIESPDIKFINRDTEDFESMLSRVARSTEFAKIYEDKEFDLQKDAIELFECAIKRLNLTLGQMERIKAVAKTITIMEGSNIIGPYHISEAIQYQVLRKELLEGLQ